MTTRPARYIHTELSDEQVRARFALYGVRPPLMVPDDDEAVGVWLDEMTPDEVREMATRVGPTDARVLRLLRSDAFPGEAIPPC